MRIPDNPRLPDASPLARQLDTLHRQVAQQVNGLSEGLMAAHYGALTASPTTGTWAQGDYIRNSAPTELGAATAMYVIMGWVCVVGGTPGTWKESRTLTGN